jgi:hypothetical protein
MGRERFYIELEGEENIFSFIAYLDMSRKNTFEGLFRTHYVIKNKKAINFLKGKYSTHIGLYAYIGNTLFRTASILLVEATFSFSHLEPMVCKNIERKIKILNLLK